MYDKDVYFILPFVDAGTVAAQVFVRPLTSDSAQDGSAKQHENNMGMIYSGTQKKTSMDDVY